MQETLTQIQNELNSISQKKKEIDAAIRVVDNMFKGEKDTCAKCGTSKYHQNHSDVDYNGYETKPDHEYVDSIYVGDLNEIEKVYSVKDLANLYITNRGLRINADIYITRITITHYLQHDMKMLD